jgi:hypothetical protein
LIEKPFIVEWHCSYLLKFKELLPQGIFIQTRHGQTAFDLKELLANRRNYEVLANVNAGNRQIVVHAGSEHSVVMGTQPICKDGSVNGDYHGQTNSPY